MNDEMVRKRIEELAGPMTKEDLAEVDACLDQINQLIADGLDMRTKPTVDSFDHTPQLIPERCRRSDPYVVLR